MKTVILTGAGISAESGLATFRASDGLWENHAIEDVATPRGFAIDPDLVQRFYDQRRRDAAAAEPNAAHRALAEWQQVDAELVIIAQNVDDLHERAGATRVLHMHGRLNSALCLACGARTPWTGELIGRPACPACGRPRLRPDIVWFGEVPYHLPEIDHHVSAADLLVVIGTSGLVYPAAGLAALARAHGARTVLLNLDSRGDEEDFDEAHFGPASQVVPTWVAAHRG